MDKNRNLRISKLLNLTEAQSETMSYLNLIADVYKNNFDLNTLQKVFTKGFNNLKAIKGIQDDEEYQKALAAVNTMLAANKQQSTEQALSTQEMNTNEETEPKVAENSSEGTKQAQSAQNNNGQAATELNQTITPNALLGREPKAGNEVGEIAKSWLKRAENTKNIPELSKACSDLANALNKYVREANNE